MVLPDRPDSVIIYIKGAPEEMLRICSVALTEQGMISMNDLAEGRDDQRTIQEDFEEKINHLSQTALRCIAFAYFEMNVDQWT